MKSYKNFRQFGFTLIELMLGIGILAILMGVGVPAYQNFIKNSCLTTTSTTFVSALQLARAESIKQRANISVCPIADANDVDGDSDVTEVLWDAGWQTVNPGADNTACTADDVVIKQFYKGGCDITTMTAVSGTNPITYAATGFLNSPAAGVTMRICDDRNNQETRSPGREVIVSVTGRPSTDSRYTGTGCPN